MMRKPLALGLLGALLLVGTASAQTQQGEGDASAGSGSGSGNVQSGSGQVATPPAPTPRPRPAAPRPTATPFRAAPAPVPTVSQPRPSPATSAPSQRPAPSKPKSRKPASGGLAGGISTTEARCLTPLERNVLRRRASGRSVTAIAAELDMAKGSVSAAEQRGLRRLVVGSKARCAKSAGDKTSATSKKRRVAQTVPAKNRVGKKAAPPQGPAAVPAGSDEPLSTAMLRPNKTGSGGFVLMLLGVLVLLLLVMAIQLRGPLLASMWRERSIERGPFKRRYPFERRGAFGPRESFSWRRPLKRR